MSLSVGQLMYCSYLTEEYYVPADKSNMSDKNVEEADN